MQTLMLYMKFDHKLATEFRDIHFFKMWFDDDGRTDAVPLATVPVYKKNRIASLLCYHADSGIWILPPLIN